IIALIVPGFIGLIIIVFLIPLAIIFIPVFMGFCVFVEIIYLGTTQGVTEIANGQIQKITYKIRSKAQKLNDMITKQIFADNDYDFSNFLSSFIIIIYLFFLWFFVLFSPFYLGKSWINVTNDPLTFFVPSKIVFDFAVQKKF